MDGDLLAPRPAAEALVARTSAAGITRRTYSPARGADKPGPHYTWVKDAVAVAGLITGWLNDRP
jgi:hypothetical protein